MLTLVSSPAHNSHATQGQTTLSISPPPPKHVIFLKAFASALRFRIMLHHFNMSVLNVILPFKITETLQKFLKLFPPFQYILKSGTSAGSCFPPSLSGTSGLSPPESS